MGSITIQYVGATTNEVLVWDGPLIDFLEDRWPNGFELPAKITDLKTGKAIEGPAIMDLLVIAR